MDVLNAMDPERAALSSVRATLDEYTPLQLTLRSMLANLASTAVAATVTYPLRVLTYKMICGQVSGPNAAWNMVTDRDQHTTTLWKGYPYYLCASLLGSVIQQGINYGIAQVCHIHVVLSSSSCSTQLRQRKQSLASPLFC